MEKCFNLGGEIKGVNVEKIINQGRIQMDLKRFQRGKKKSTYSTLPVHRLECILVISDVEAATAPLVRFGILVFLLRKNKRFHANVVRGVILLQIVDIEANRVPLANIAHRKEVPLRIVERVVVKIQKEVVLAVLHPFNLSQVARFELCIEKECFFGYVSDVDRCGRGYQTLGRKVGVHTSTSHRILYKLFNM